MTQPHLSLHCFQLYHACTVQTKTSDCNQGKCQHVREPHCSLPQSLLINPVLRFAKTLFGWWELATKGFPLSQDCSWLAFWLKVLPKYSFLVTVAPRHFLSQSLTTHRHTHTLTHSRTCAFTYFLLGCPMSMWGNFSLLTSCLPPRQKQHHYFLPAQDNATV